MANKPRGETQTLDQRPGRPPLAVDIENARKQRILDEMDENLGSEATEGSPESPANTGGEHKVAQQEAELDAAGDDDESGPAAQYQEIRNAS